MDLLHYSDPLLKEASKTFDFNNPPFNPIDFSQELVKIMRNSNGICLSAIQIGVSYRVFALHGNPNLVLFNPRLLVPSSEEIRLEETSLTYLGLCVKVKRSQHIKVRYYHPNSEVKTETFTGLTARYFQHCMDFLNGRLFYENANPIHRSQALKKWKR